jgi:hypothetical protein
MIKRALSFAWAAIKCALSFAWAALVFTALVVGFGLSMIVIIGGAIAGGLAVMINKA